MEPITPIFTKPVTQQLRHHYDQTELLEAGKKLSETYSQYGQIEADKKRSMTDFNAKLAAVKAEALSLSEKVSTGYDIRDVECTVTMDTPTRGKKTITRDDTAEQVAVEVMTPSENSESDARRKSAEFESANPTLNMEIVQPGEKSDEEHNSESNESANPDPKPKADDPIEPGDEQPGDGEDEEGEDEEEPEATDTKKKKGKK